MKIYIGVGKDGRVCDSASTLEQINTLMNDYTLDICSDGVNVSWEDIYSNKEGLSGYPIINAIIEDRKVRVDKKTIMANRPMFAVATINDNKTIERLEFYEGRNKLEKEYDLRSKSLSGKFIKDSHFEDGL